jgi:hypothetical protein
MVESRQHRSNEPCFKLGSADVANSVNQDLTEQKTTTTSWKLYHSP